MRSLNVRTPIIKLCGNEIVPEKNDMVILPSITNAHSLSVLMR